MKRLCIMLAAVAVFLPLPQAFSMPIEKVEVQVVDVNAGTSAPLLEKMNSSMQVVAEQLLVDKDVEKTAGAAKAYERLFTEIGDRVFTGYELQRVDLEVGSATKVKLYLHPWSEVVRRVRVDLQFSGMDTPTAVMLKKRLVGLEKELQEIITGASVDAVDWAGGILRRRVRQRVEQALPDFKVAVDLLQEAGAEQAVVQVIIYPVGQIVSSISYEMHSETIPNIILMQLKYRYASRCEELRGLPVGYVQRHRSELENMLMEELKQEKLLQDFVLQPKVTLTPGSDMGIDISLSTQKYKIWVEGYADIGRDDDNLSGRLHLGKYISGKDEVFVEGELVTDDVHWSTSLGYAHDWGKSTWSYRRRMPESDNAYKLEYRLGPKWGLRAEHYSGINRNEYALRYRIHEFLSCEYVYGGKDSYFRIIGNL